MPQTHRSKRCNATPTPCPPGQGKFDGTVNGQAATKAQPGSREGSEPVERFAQPLIHLDTPVAASFVTPDQISLFSGQSTSHAMANGRPPPKQVAGAASSKAR